MKPKAVDVVALATQLRERGVQVLAVEHGDESEDAEIQITAKISVQVAKDELEFSVTLETGEGEDWGIVFGELRHHIDELIADILDALKHDRDSLS